MESLAHHALVQHVVQRHQAHPLVVRHIRVNNHPISALPLLLSAVIERLIEAHLPVHPHLHKPFQILDRLSRVHQQRERRCIRRNHQIIFQSSLQPQRRHPKRVVLIRPVRIQAAMRRLRNPPRHPPVSRVGNLPLHRLGTSILQQRIPETPHIQHRHQVLKHRPAPRQQNLPVRRRIRSAQRQPMLRRHVSLRNRHQAP